MSAPQAPPANGDPIAAAPLPHPPRAVAFAQIERFLGAKGPVEPNEVPWPLDRVDVLDFIVERASQRALSEAGASRLSLLSCAYLLHELPGLSTPCFEEPVESAEQVVMLAYLCEAASRVAPPAALGPLGQRYEALVAHAQGVEAVTALLCAREALGPAVSSDSLARLVQSRVAALADGDAEDAVLARDLDEDAASLLQDVAWADEARRGFAGLDDAAAGRTWLLDVYLERADFGGEAILVPWAALELRKQAYWLGAPVVRESLAAEVAASRERRDSDEAVRFEAVRALRASQFFGGSLARQDREFLDEFGSEQVDLLSWDRLGPQPDYGWLGVET